MTQQVDSIINSLPFTLDDLIAKEDYKLPIYPDNQHWLAAMKEKKSQHPEDSTPVEKIMKSLVEISEGVWGLQLPKKCCLFVAERKLIKQQASARNEAILAYARLCQKISKALKIPITKVQEMMREPFKYMEKLDRWMEEITASLTNLEVTDIGVATVTVMIQQRLISFWTEHDTLALPESLFDKFLKYSENEEKNWQEEKAEGRGVMSEGDDVIDGEIEEFEEEVEAEVIEGKTEQKQIVASSDLSSN
ncbi:MAG: hypothetical protein ACRC2S_28525 [Waterburya sp.]